MATASKRPRTESTGAPGESAPRPPSAVYVLVRTSDGEGMGCDWECNADSEVVGVYTSSELAERAKRNATKGYETTDEINYIKASAGTPHSQFTEKQLKTRLNRMRTIDGLRHLRAATASRPRANKNVQ